MSSKIKNNTDKNNEKCKIGFDENSFIGSMIKKIKEGVMNDNFKNEFIVPVYEEAYLYIYPHYIIFFALLVSIIVLELLIFFTIFAFLRTNN